MKWNFVPLERVVDTAVDALSILVRLLATGRPHCHVLKPKRTWFEEARHHFCQNFI